MGLRRLIFFTTSDPASDPGSMLRAYHFAGVAAGSGLDAEVRLAGDAVSVADINRLPDTALGRDVAAKVVAGVDAPFLVSL